jgi:hypothetical protein
LRFELKLDQKILFGSNTELADVLDDFPIRSAGA